MISISDVVYQNELEAVGILKKMDNNEVIFNHSGDDAVIYQNGSEPYVLIGSDDDNSATDMMVSKARLKEDGNNIEFYIPELKEWVNSSYPLGYTENNVYESIASMV